jgi:long-chain acyl-CoA synthetase
VGVERFGAVAGRVVARLAKQVETAIAAEDLSLAQYRVLGLLAEGERASSRLAERLAVRPNSVTSLVDGLVARGLVERGADPEDRRRLPLALTEKGSAALDRANAAVGARLHEVLSHASPPDRSTLKTSLQLWQHTLDERRERRTAGS